MAPAKATSWRDSKSSTNLSDFQNEIFFNEDTSERNSSNGSFTSKSSDSPPSSPKTQTKVFSITGRSSNSAFLEKLKYFEEQNNKTPAEPSRPQKNDKQGFQHQHSPSLGLVRKLSLKKTINEVRAQFPKDLEVKSGDYANNSAQSSKVSRSELKDQDLQSTTTPLEVKTEDQKLPKPEQKKTINGVKIENVLPIKQLALKKTINDVRARFRQQDLNYFNKNGEEIPVKNIEYLSSNCAQFFSTCDNQFLLNETSIVQKQFRTMLKGTMYQCNFYSFENSDKHNYYLHDFFDYDLFTLDLFDTENPEIYVLDMYNNI